MIRILVLLLGGLGLFAVPAGAQITVVSPERELRPIRGTVVDATSGRPIDGAYVLAQITQSLTRTDAEGHFQLILPEGPQRLVVTRVGYGELEVVVDPEEEDERVRIEVSPVPVELPGIQVEGRSFQARFDSVNAALSQRATARWAGAGRGSGGVPRFAPIEKIRKYDDVDDPAFALRALGVSLDLMDVEFCAFRAHGRTVQPTLVIDGEVHDFRGCDRFREMDVRHICRMEAIPSYRNRMAALRTSTNYDLYVWTCGFMARLAAGQEDIPEFFDILEPVWGGVGN